MSKKRSIQSKSDHGAILRQPCRYHLKGTCTRSPRECWHRPECQFYKTETECKAGDKCLFPRFIRLTNNKITSPKTSYHSHKGKESDDKIAVAIVKIVPQLGFFSQDSDAFVSQRGKQSRKPEAKKSWDHLEKCITQSTTSSKHAGKERTISWKCRSILLARGKKVLPFTSTKEPEEEIFVTLELFSILPSHEKFW